MWDHPDTGEHVRTYCSGSRAQVDTQLILEHGRAKGLVGRYVDVNIERAGEEGYVHFGGFLFGLVIRTLIDILVKSVTRRSS